MDWHHHPPVCAADRLAVLGCGLLRHRPSLGQTFETAGGERRDRQHAASKLARRDHPRGRDRIGDEDRHVRLLIGLDLKMGVVELEEGAVERDAALLGEEPHYRLDALDHPAALLGGIDAEHVRVRRQRSRTASKHHAPACQMVEQGIAVGDIERVMVGDADHARAEHYAARAPGGSGDENVRRRNDLPPRGMMLADEDLVVAGTVQPFDKFEVALEAERGVFAGAMERRHENAEFHPILLGPADRAALGALSTPPYDAAHRRDNSGLWREASYAFSYDSGAG